MKKITGVHHVALYAKDFAKSKAFYTHTLGLTECAAWDGAVMLDCHDGTCIELFDGAKESPQGGWVHLAFRTDDCDGAYAAAIAAGAVCQSEPKDVDIQAEPQILPVRIAFVKGYDGETIEFFQIRA